jgi:hypothetical protein
MVGDEMSIDSIPDVGLRAVVRELLEARAALATAVIATGIQMTPNQQVAWPADEPILRRHRPSTGERSWFVRDAEHLWWMVHRNGAVEAWLTRRRVLLV